MKQPEFGSERRQCAVLIPRNEPAVMLPLSRSAVLFGGKPAPAGEKTKSGVQNFFQSVWRVLTAPFRWMGSLLEWMGLKKKKAAQPQSQPASGKSSVASTAAQRVQLTTQQLFGPQPSRITMVQHSGNTCYLLSSLDNIFHHPQSLKILDQIQVHQAGGQYSVKFPGQASDIMVNQAELEGPVYQGVESDCLGVKLLEKAYSKIPGINYGDFDTGSDALKRIFGPGVGSLAPHSNRVNPDLARFEEPPPTLESSAHREAERHQNQDYADIWIGQPTYYDDKGLLQEKEHYYSIRLRPNDPLHFDLADPFDTKNPQRISLNEINRRNAWVAELIRIPLQKPRQDGVLPCWRGSEH